MTVQFYDSHTEGAPDSPTSELMPFYLQLDSLKQRVEENLSEAIGELERKLAPFVVPGLDGGSAENKVPQSGSPVTNRVQRIDDSVMLEIDRIHNLLRSLDI